LHQDSEPPSAPNFKASQKSLVLLPLRCAEGVDEHPSSGFAAVLRLRLLPSENLGAPTQRC
jgi:hypothetical protein